MKLVSFFLLNLRYPYTMHWFTRILTTVTLHGAQRIHQKKIGFYTYRNASSESFVELNILPILHPFFGLLISLTFFNINAFFVACFMYLYHNNLLPRTFNTTFVTNHQVHTYNARDANDYRPYFCRKNSK